MVGEGVAELGEHVDGFCVEVEQVAAGAEGVFQPDQLPPAVEVGDADQVEMVAAVVEYDVDDGADGGTAEVGQAGWGVGPGHPVYGVEDLFALGFIGGVAHVDAELGPGQSLVVGGERHRAPQGAVGVSPVRNEEVPEEVQILRTSPMASSWGSVRTTYSTSPLTWWIELIRSGSGWPLCCTWTRSPTWWAGRVLLPICVAVVPLASSSDGLAALCHKCSVLKVQCTRSIGRQMCTVLGVENQPAVVAMAELIEMLGLSKARVVQLIASPGFPRPLAVIKAGKIWSYADVQTWAESGGRTVLPIPPR